jgi:hypothetical protein
MVKQTIQIFCRVKPTKAKKCVCIIFIFTYNRGINFGHSDFMLFLCFTNQPRSVFGDFVFYFFLKF